MRRRIFIKQMTPAEAGDTRTHEKYVRLPNNFEHEIFFQQKGVTNGSVVQIDFEAAYNGDQNDLIPLKFVYYANSNHEKRIPSLGPIFDKYNVTSSDIVYLESITDKGKTSFSISFKKESDVKIYTSPIFYEIEELENVPPNLAHDADKNLCLQKIFYGAPGTGKSHRIKEQLEGVSKENIFRTTFHPDSDYSTFVGAYKPTKGKKPLYGLNGGLTVRLNNGEDLSEDIITYDFIAQTFLKAYMRAYQTDENVYLIIEEINRGNCAQIFGDLFQLLDRDVNGVSEYTIKADADLKTFLEEEMGVDSDAIRDGELCLPSNLYIYATMNTSDQSLFPIDSAFKRRWDWEYEPIKYKNIDWKIVIGGTEYSWVSFQRKVNEKILGATSSEDKMLGDYFVNPSDGIITDKVLLNKILFYLWNDVCKDGEGDIFKASETEDVSFSELYGDGGKQKLISIMEYLKVAKIETDEEDIDDESVEENSDDSTKYSINGETTDEKGRPWGKGSLVKRAVELYCQKFSNLPANQVRDNWMSVGFRIQHIVETEEDKQKRLFGSQDKTGRERCKQIILSNGESIYVSTEVGSDKVYNVFEDFLSKIQSKPEWGINIQKL